MHLQKCRFLRQIELQSCIIFLLEFFSRIVKIFTVVEFQNTVLDLLTSRPPVQNSVEFFCRVVELQSCRVLQNSVLLQSSAVQFFSSVKFRCRVVEFVCRVVDFCRVVQTCRLRPLDFFGRVEELQSFPMDFFCRIILQSWAM